MSNADTKLLHYLVSLSNKDRKKVFNESKKIINNIKTKQKSIEFERKIKNAANRLSNSLAKGKKGSNIKNKKNTRKKIRLDMIKNLRSRNNLRIKVLKKTCKIRRRKIKQNKYQRKKKQLLRLTNKLCKHKKIVRKINSQIQTLKMKHNKAYK